MRFLERKDKKLLMGNRKKQNVVFFSRGKNTFQRGPTCFPLEGKVEDM